MGGIIYNSIKQKRLSDIYNYLDILIYYMVNNNLYNLNFMNTDGNNLVLNYLFDLFELFKFKEDGRWIFEFDKCDVIYKKNFLKYKQNTYGNCCFPGKKIVYCNNFISLKKGKIKYSSLYQNITDYIHFMMCIINILQIENNLFSDNEIIKENHEIFLKKTKKIKIPIKLLRFIEECIENMFNESNNRIIILNNKISEEKEKETKNAEYKINIKTKLDEINKIISNFNSNVVKEKEEKKKLLIEIENCEKNEEKEKKINEYKKKIKLTNIDEQIKESDDIKIILNNLEIDINESNKKIKNYESSITYNKNLIKVYEYFLKIIKMSILISSQNQENIEMVNVKPLTSELESVLTLASAPTKEEILIEESKNKINLPIAVPI